MFQQQTVMHETCCRDMNIVCRYLWLIFIVAWLCGHTWTCRYPDFKVLTLLSPCGCLVGVIYMYNDGSLPNNHQSLSGSDFVSFRQQHTQYTLRLAMEVVTLIQD